MSKPPYVEDDNPVYSSKIKTPYQIRAEYQLLRGSPTKPPSDGIPYYEWFNYRTQRVHYIRVTKTAIAPCEEYQFPPLVYKSKTKKDNP